MPLTQCERVRLVVRERGCTTSRGVSGADLSPFSTLRLGIGWPTAVVGFLNLVLRLGHLYRSVLHFQRQVIFQTCKVTSNVVFGEGVGVPRGVEPLRRLRSRLNAASSVSRRRAAPLSIASLAASAPDSNVGT